MSLRAVPGNAFIKDHGELVNNQAMMGSLSEFANAPDRSGGERRQGDVCTGTEGVECEVVCHDVSQRGAARRGVEKRGAKPISSMRPPQRGHKSRR